MNVPNEVGVPEKWPADESVIPGGRLPETTVNETAGTTVVVREVSAE